MADPRPSSNAPGKRCFVTIGATAPFNSLVRAVLEPAFLKPLREAGYTQLRIQFGNHEGETIFRERCKSLKEAGFDKGIDITGFGFSREGLREEMLAVKGRSQVDEGMVISHAGSGSVLDALRIGVPIVVVPNTDLLHNHQVELAEALAEQEYVIHGKLGSLADSIASVEELRKRMKKWPPLRSGEEKYRRGLEDVIAEEMGWQID
ncbi:uncharacterized protein A1O5_03616 [Cladophialophora psammophila CBS 110553]|uniref:UDP-N-acetylglucosamine transferase subunit ALG13 n=1 Tax=Cladophialophora psammophila CBS 110553 TaxID=1182543 RepID=W9XUD2_9EURO|nr:uncharacterized protein A1O5_03616 [Cladophialophora psammophila CBS 110553]EXJ73854.1 hypothetical protein A1O5_03616 [Cladophialophora psammophila CBS 110553]